MGGRNHSHATQDLFEAIESGTFPEWGLFIQTMDPADELKFSFDPLDDTKVCLWSLFQMGGGQRAFSASGLGI